MTRKLSFLFTVLMIFVVSSVCYSQVTFEKYIGGGNAKYISQNPDGSYIAGFDSGRFFNILKMDPCGNTVFYRTYHLRDSDRVVSVEQDYTNGYIIGGSSTEYPQILFTAEPFLLKIDSVGDTLWSRIVPGLDWGGFGNIVLPTNDSNYAFVTWFDGLTSDNYSKLYKYDMNGNQLFDSLLCGSPVSNSGLYKDSLDNIFYTCWDQTNASYLDINKTNKNGVTVNSSRLLNSPNDSAINSTSLCKTTDDGFLIGTQIYIGSTGTRNCVLLRVSDSFDTLWSKNLPRYLNPPLSICQDADSGFFLLMNNGGIELFHINSVGDSIATIFYNGSANKMIKCDDGGYIIVGNNSGAGYIIKTDGFGHSQFPVQISINGSSILCPGDSTILHVPSGYITLWSDSSTNDSLLVVGAGNYYAILTDQCGNSISTDTIAKVSFLTNPNISIVGDSISCVNDTILLIAPNGTNYIWSNGDTTQTISINGGSSFFVSYLDSNGCIVNSDTAHVVFNPPPPIPVINQFGQMLIASNGTQFQWTFNGSILVGEIFDTLVPSQSGIYTVLSLDSISCYSESMPYNFIFTNINESAFSDFDIYPNPTTDKIIVDFGIYYSNLGGSILGIVNLYDQIVYQGQINERKYSLDSSKIGGKGVYFIYIKNPLGKRSMAKRIVVE